MKKFLATTAALIAFAAPAMAEKLPTDLNAKIVRAEGAGGGRVYMYYLVTVSNFSNQIYKLTWWSCAFFLKGEPVHEDTFIVKQVAANGRTIHKTVTEYHRFDSSECRLTEVGAD